MIDICTMKFVFNFFSYGKQSLRPSVSTDGFYLYKIFMKNLFQRVTLKR